MEQEVLGDVSDIADEAPPLEVSRGVPCEIEPGWSVVVVRYDDHSFRLFDETHNRTWDPVVEDARLAIKRSISMPEIFSDNGAGIFVVSGEDHAGFYLIDMTYEPGTRRPLGRDGIRRI